MTVTADMRLREAFAHPRLKPYLPYAMYHHEVERILLRQRIRKICRFSNWNEKDILRGLNRLQELAGADGDFVFRVYAPEEIAEDPAKQDALVFHFPVKEKTPFAVVVSGGAYTSVCNVSEGFAVAARLNELGYHAFVVNYRTQGQPPLMPKPINDLARAVGFILEYAASFNIEKEYFITGYSAGGNLVNLFCTENLGYRQYGLTAPKACFPVYSTVDVDFAHTRKPDRFYRSRFGKRYSNQVFEDYDIVRHLAGFPPAYLVHCKDDPTVPCEQSEKLAAALEREGIPHRLELGEKGGHGFGVGTGSSVEGWLDRAVAFYQGL